MTHAELIAALEAATEPSRELDAEIAKALGWIPESRLNDPDWWVRQDGVRLSLPCFTSSLDAAMTLVPEGWWYDLAQFGGPVGGKSAFRARLTVPAPLRTHEGAARIAPVALCIAALKARAAKENAA